MNKVTTRKDVMGIIDLYNQHKIIPLAARLDEIREKVVAYMALPLWRRRWLRLKRLGDGVLDGSNGGGSVCTLWTLGHEIRGHLTRCIRSWK